MKLFLIIILLCITVWYSRQKSNNPFARPSHVEICTDSLTIAITLKSPERKKLKTRVQVGSSWIYCETHTRDSLWDYFTTNSSATKPSEKSPAKSFELDYKNGLFIPAQLPQSTLSKPDSIALTLAGAKMEWIHSDSGSKPLLVNFYKAKILIMIEPLELDSMVLNKYKEKIELLIIPSKSTFQVETIRKSLRPRYIVHLNDKPKIRFRLTKDGELQAYDKS